MKRLMKISFILFCVLSAAVGYGQIRSVTLQASGLTCSMCSRAIYKSLQKVPDVIRVKEDIEHSSYQVVFSDPVKISLEKLKKAIQDAGFSVAWMKVNANFNQVIVASDSSLKFNDFVFLFVKTNRQTLNGEKTLLVLDKDYLLEKERRKYIDSKGGKSIAGPDVKTFHVTLTQS
jgi:copper chaperone CopZ